MKPKPIEYKMDSAEFYRMILQINKQECISLHNEILGIDLEVENKHILQFLLSPLRKKQIIA